MNDSPNTRVPDFNLKPEPQSWKKSFFGLGFIAIFFLVLVGSWVGFFSGFSRSRGDPQKLIEVMISSPNPELARGAALEWSQNHSQTSTLSSNDTGLVVGKINQMDPSQKSLIASFVLVLGDSQEPEKVQPLMCSLLEKISSDGEGLVLFLAGLGKSLNRGFHLPQGCLDSLNHFQNHPLVEVRATYAILLGADFLKILDVESQLLILFQDSFEAVKRAALLSLVKKQSSLESTRDFIEKFFLDSSQISSRNFKVEDYEFTLALLGVVKKNPPLLSLLGPQFQNLSENHPNLRIRSEFKKILETKE